MKKINMLRIVILLIIPTISFSQYFANSISQPQQKDDAQYSKVDFFKDQKKLFCWSGPISDTQNGRGISEIPLMEYNDLAAGQCRIICYPKGGLSSWEAIISSIRDLELEHKEVRKIALIPEIQNQYNIYAFYVATKDLIPFQDLGDPNARDVKYPCDVSIYKKKIGKWILIKQVRIKNDSEYAQLKFSTVIGE